MTEELLHIDDPYERRAWREYQQWAEHGREAGVTTQVLQAAGSKALEVGGNAWDKVKGTRGGELLQRAGESAQDLWESEQVQQLYAATMSGITGAYKAAVDASLQTVDPDKVVKHYGGHADGASVGVLRDLPLLVLDSNRPAVHGQYRAQLTASSGATGTAQGLTSVTGVAAAGVMVADVLATIGLSARGIATHLAHYGYDVTDHTEHAYVLTLMQTSMAETAVERAVLTQQARSLAINLAKNKT